jgi:two-component system, OmpR family, response regulator CssR
MHKIYVVDDEKDLLNIIRKYLEKEGYKVRTFSDGESAIKAINDEVHLWLLDIMLGSDISGYDVLTAINENHPVPAIFMSARDQEIDRIMGLELGSDDYITKPFSMREMVLRVNNVVKRVYGRSNADIKRYSNYTIDIKKRLVLKDDKPIVLTAKEINMVIFLISSMNTSFTREQLLNNVWGDSYFGSDRVVDDLIKRIRKKMPNFDIETIYGYGYRLR